jgi:hypothetical protein
MRTNGVWRNGRIWITHHVGAVAGGCVTDAAPATKTEVAWYQINPASIGAFPGGMPVQQGKVQDASLYYRYSSIAVNAAECVMVGFSGSDAATFAGAYYTFRAPTDPPNTMQAVGLLKAGVDTYRKFFGGTRNRWGDYSATCVDPVDDSTLWTLQEYAETEFAPGACAVDTGRWSTWWGAVPCVICAMPGDVNVDLLINSVDIQHWTNCAINGVSPGGNCGCADMNGDTFVNATDQSLFVTAVLTF